MCINNVKNDLAQERRLPQLCIFVWFQIKPHLRLVTYHHHHNQSHNNEYLYFLAETLQPIISPSRVSPMKLPHNKALGKCQGHLSHRAHTGGIYLIKWKILTSVRLPTKTQGMPTTPTRKDDLLENFQISLDLVYIWKIIMPYFFQTPKLHRKI